MAQPGLAHLTQRRASLPLVPLTGGFLGRPPPPGTLGRRIFTSEYHMEVICWCDPVGLGYDYCKGQEIGLGNNMIVFPHHASHLKFQQ